jgi:hypothetical protein
MRTGENTSAHAKALQYPPIAWLPQTSDNAHFSARPFAHSKPSPTAILFLFT